MTDTDDPMLVPRHYGYRIEYRITQTGAITVAAPDAVAAVTLARRLLGVTGSELFEVVTVTTDDD